MQTKIAANRVIFLAPPTQRSQCRYFNVERLTEWAINLLNLSPKTLMTLIPESDLSLVTDRLIDKLGWLIGYESELIKWSRMVLLTRSVETHLKRAGISHQSPNHFEKERVVFSDPAVENLHQQIFHYLNIQSAKLKDGDTFLATSDVIESLFGKYKLFRLAVQSKRWVKRS